MFADLHVHTTASDGRLTVPEIPARAREAGVSVVAVTDHDRVHPALDAPVEVRDGVRVVRGVELRVDTGERRVDLLGYGVDPTEALTAELERVQRDRVERAREMVDLVETETGVTLDLTLEPGVGRPHVARAVAESAAPHDYGEAFRQLIGSDRPCYVPRDVTDVETGVALLRESCGLVSLAHPFRYDDPEAALALCADLDGVERFYEYGRQVDTAPVSRAVERHDLVPTGGSDAHDHTLGVAGLDRAEWDRVASRLPGAES
ncbi:MAG: putative metal-dependent phosphoesterases (PHP family) [uncultured archaeon A07HB70]|nr:MAG: putative metal-dependent phosphoesterases (PHP family) [uncultured archaeon A07HB70]